MSAGIDLRRQRKRDLQLSYSQNFQKFGGGSKFCRAVEVENVETVLEKSEEYPMSESSLGLIRYASPL